MAETLYDILGITPSATPEQVREAYLRLAKQHHPDKNPGDESASDRFRRIQHAYDVLSTPETRMNYDLTGNDATQRVDIDPEASLHSEAVSLLGEAMSAHSEPWRVDLITTMNQLLQAKELTVRHALVRISQDIKRLEKMCRRFRRKTGVVGINALDSAIAQHLQTHLDQKKRFEDSLTMFARVKEYVNSYEFDIEVAQATPAVGIIVEPV